MKTGIPFAFVAYMSASTLNAFRFESSSQAPEGSQVYSNHLVFDEVNNRLTLVNANQPPDLPESGELWFRDGNRWTRALAAGPSLRTLAGVAYDSRRDRIVLYGGVGARSRSDVRSDTWEWDGTRWWRMSDSSPGARDHHAMVFDVARGATLLFGGVTANRVHTTETWLWAGARWSLAATSGPTGRAGVSLAYDAARQEVILFGGVQSDAVRVNDTWSWNGRAWTQRSNRGPRPRNGAAMTFDARSNVVLLFGGTTGSEHLDDLWQWNGREWTEISTTEPRPGRRVGATMTWDARRGKVVLYGGHIRVDGQVRNSYELWEWDGARWTQVN